MTGGNSNEASLEHVLDQLVEAEEMPGPAVLDRWVREYPQFESELVDFIASWTLMTSAASEYEEETDEDSKVDERLMLRGMSVVQNVLHEMAKCSNATSRLDSLLGAGKIAGLSLSDLARATHLGDALVRKLDRRLIRFSSIPNQAIDAIAKAVRCPAQAVSWYLQQAPTLPAGAHYRADRPPQLAEPEDFRLAVEKDPTMPSEDRRLWLEAINADES